MNPKLGRYPHVHYSARSIGSFRVKISDPFCCVRRQVWLATLALALVVAIPGLAAAQTSAVRPRITARVDDTVRTVLHGNTHPLAKAQYDQGAVADGQPIHRMLLLLQRGPDQEAALKQLMDQQHSKDSPTFHQWLTPQQFGLQFGPADADVQTVTNWLQSHGFQVARVSTGKTVIEFSGNAGQVRNAFHTEIHKYLVDGKQYFANNSDPQIPTALAPAVAGTVSLHNFPHHALIKKLGAFRKATATGKVTPLDTFSNPNYCGTTSDCNAVGPGDFAKIYNVLPLWTATPAIDGTGQTIAIVGDSEICTQQNTAVWNMSYLGPYGTMVTCNSDDVATFRSLFGLPPNPPTVILDGPDPGFNVDETEGDLDVEWSGAVAKGATIDYVIAEDTEATYGTDLAAEDIVDNNLAPVLSESYGECENYLGNGGNAFEATLWEQAAAQGITVIVSAGDDGSAMCDDGYNVAEYGLAVNGIASTPFDVAAGGTDFDVTAANYQSTYWNPTNSIAGNTTYDGLLYASALSYIPETTWNDSCAQNLTSGTAGNTCSSGPTPGGITGGGGGQSNCIPGSDGYCDYYYGKPSWQTLPENGAGLTTLTGTNPDFTRDLPDISLFAADGYISNSFYIICEADVNPTTTNSETPCNLNTPYHDVQGFDFVGVGGTSSSAPTFAGMMAMVNQEMTILNANGTNPQYPTQQGNANYVLYNLFSSQSGSSCNSSTGPEAACTFNDVTKGNNSVPCTPYIYEGYDYTFGCSASLGGTYGVNDTVNFYDAFYGDELVLTNDYAFDAAPGPDMATGLGTINAYNLVNKWGAAVGNFTPTTTTLCLSMAQIPSTTTSCSYPQNAPITITHGTPIYVNIAVNGTVSGNPIPVSETASENSGGTPSVTEDVSLIGTFPNGNPSCNIPGCTTGGVDHYTSNGVEPMNSGTLVPYAPNYQISNTGIYPLTDGTFSSATTSSANYTTFLTGGNYNVVAHYGGDGSYGASSSTTPMWVTVNPENSTSETCVFVYNPNPSVEATTGYVLLQNAAPTPPYYCSPAMTATYGEPVTIRVDVIGASLQESATGSVTLMDNGGPLVGPTGTPTTSFTLSTEGYLEDQTAFLAASAAGFSHTFLATYQGDASYLNSPTSSPITLTVTQATTTTTVASSATTGVSSTQNITLTATVDTLSYGNWPTGSVTFYNGATALGTVPITAAQDTLDPNEFDEVQVPLTTKLAAGTASITAAYVGDTNYTNSTSTPAVTFPVTAPPPLTVTTTTASLPTGVVSVAYPATQLQASGGVPPNTWTLISGSLPTGFPALPTSGLISGTPSANAAGTYPFTVQVEDSVGTIATSPSSPQLSITINASLLVTTASVPTNITAGATYSTPLAASGGIPPYTWTLNSGSLPGGLGLNSSNGSEVISGDPTGASVANSPYTFTLQVKDSTGTTANSASFSIAVLGVTFTQSSSSPVTITTLGVTQTQLITLNATPGFTGTATLGATLTSSPTGAYAADDPTAGFSTPNSANFSPSTDVMSFASASTGDATIYFGTTPKGASIPPSTGPLDRNWPMAVAAVSLLCIFFLLVVPKQRRWGLVPLAVLLVVVVAGGFACGGSAISIPTTGTTNPGTTAGAYVFTVTAMYSDGAVLTTAITVTVP